MAKRDEGLTFSLSWLAASERGPEADRTAGYPLADLDLLGPHCTFSSAHSEGVYGETVPLRAGVG
jgi:hypothetical protein